MKGDLQGHADHFRRASRVHSLVTTGSSSECLTQEPSTHWPLPGGGSLRLESMVHSAPRCSPWEDKERGETSWCRQGMKSCVLWETGLYLRYSIKEDITKTRGGEIHEVRFEVLREKILRVPQVPPEAPPHWELWKQELTCEHSDRAKDSWPTGEKSLQPMF